MPSPSHDRATAPPSGALNIRPIDPDDASEIDLVARRMRETLIEVEGPEVGRFLYTLDWLRERVRWHLDRRTATGKVYLAATGDGQIVGHTIVRGEADEQGPTYGLFSTIYVVPAARRAGVARQLLLYGERWMAEQAYSAAATWTSATNAPLIGLFSAQGYVCAERHVHATTGTLMVKLAKQLAAPTAQR